MKMKQYGKTSNSKFLKKAGSGVEVKDYLHDIQAN